MKLDALFIEPNSSKEAYQSLAIEYSAIETPTWALLLAQSCRSVGWRVSILDANAERLTDEEVIKRVEELQPRLVVFVMYGQNPNSGTTMMIGAYRTGEKLADALPSIPICMVGSHVSALPKEVLAKPFVDFVLLNEGVYALRNLLQTDLDTCQQLEKVKGIGWKADEVPILNPPQFVVPNDRMDIDMPGYAWDLLPYRNKPFDLYRAHFWHANFDKARRTPFAAIYTSLGCRFGCDFCLTGDTKISLSEKKNQKIKNVKVGDKLLAWDENRLEISETKVVAVSSRTVDIIYNIKLTDGKIIKCTGEHPFYKDGEWTNAKNLRVGDRLLVIDPNDKLIFRMRHYNPMRSHSTQKKVSFTKKQNFLSGKETPFLCTTEGRKMASETARRKMFSDDNPMYCEHNQEKARQRFLKENNPHWNGGTCVKLKPYYLSKNKRIRALIKKRDNNTCQECQTSTGKIDVHHINYNKYDNQSSNLMTLCAKCHTKTNFDRDFWQKRYTKLMLERSKNCPHYVRVEEINIKTENTEVFNLRCEPYNNYFANNTLTHNCMINILNRANNADGISSTDSRIMRFWSPDFITKEFEKLANYGIETLRITDEMFFLDKRYFEPLLKNIIDRGLKLNMWSYARIDTVRKQYLELFKKAGVNWLALGIEAAKQKIRTEVSKGSFQNVNIRQVCKDIQNADINVISNFIFGFPEDTKETMQETLDLALEINAETTNMYPCMALPGSPLHVRALKEGWKLPSSPEGYAFLSYESEPLPTKYCTSAEVLKFRDDAWHTYFVNPKYLELVERKFGAEQRKNVEDLAKIRLKRKILGD